jgi:hypothetical protein
MSALVKRALLIVTVVALAAAGTVGTARIWTAIGGGPLSLHGWIAMAVGIGGSIALAWVLMTLAFRSDSEGWDARADRLPADDAATSKPPAPPEV